MMAGALLGTLNLMAQDNLWVHGSQLLDFNASLSSSATVCNLPIGPTGIDYQGAQAQFSQNAQYDENGKLLFFVVDGAIYDHAGYLMADNDRAPNCTDCLPRGIQEVSIVLMPGTCDRYYVISGRSRNYNTPGADPACEWSIAGDMSFLAYSVLDLSMPNPYHPGRRGTVWHEEDLYDMAVEHPEYVDNMVSQLFSNCLNENDPRGPAIFRIASGNDAVDPGAANSSRMNNIYHVVYDGTVPSSPKTLFARTAMEFLYAPITAHGIPSMGHLAYADPDNYNNADSWLTMTGGLSVAQGPDGVVRLACTNNRAMAASLCSQYPTVQVLTLHFAGSAITSTQQWAYSCNDPNPTANTGLVRGIAFSPNGRYLYFAQPFSPYLGYFDMLDPTLTVHDVAAELSLAPSSLIPYAKGQIRMNQTPDRLGHAIYFPSQNDMGYIEDPDDPSSFTWHTSMATTAPLATPPNSAAALQGSWPVTQYLMDMQNYRDQQLPSLLQPACCLANERIPEASHSYSFSGTTSFTSPWTPQNNGLTDPVLCASPGGGGSTGHVYFDTDFIVMPGAKLFVRDMEWRFAPYAKLVLMPGAFAQFDNCVLRGDICAPQRWPGAVVMGTPSLPQGTSSYPPNHGRLVLNNSTVQDAHVGVALGVKMGPAILAPGGILESKGSTFLNCRIGADFQSYRNLLANGTELSNRSYFHNTTFTTNQGYINHPMDGYDFLVNTQMWRVKGIRFQGCTFQNLRTTEHNSNQLGQGIRSLDANFSVTSRCADPGPVPPGMCQNVIPTRFTGLDMGIRAAKATSSFNFTVDGAEFTNNVCGIYANSVLNFEVHNSNFEVGSSKATDYSGQDDEYYWNGAHRGIYSFQSWGFLVDDNTLTNNPNATTSQLEGIVTGYSNAHNDVVFRNHASNLQAGFVGEGVCADPNNRALIGLTYLCNTNSGNVNDIWDRQVTNDPSTYANQTIRTTQGSFHRPADNSFGQQAVGHLDIKNTNYPNNTLGYNWALPSVPFEPVYYSTGVYPNNMDGSGNLIIRPTNNCASRVLPPIPDPSPGPVALRGQYLITAQAHKAAYGNTRYLYDQLIDGGSTDETVQEIQSTWPSEAWDLRQALLDKSPYLSTDVLFEVVKKNIMPPAMVAEICIANPEATKKEGFLKWLQFESPCLMPQYLIDNIEASWETKTYRTSMEDNLAYQHQAMTQALDLTLASYHADTLVAYKVDSIRATWQVLRTTSARYAEILTYLEQDNYDSAYAVMDRLPVEFRLKEKEISEKDRTKQFIGIVQGYRNSGRSEAELNEGDLAALRTLAADAHDRPAEWAQNILCFGYGECRPTPSGGDDKGGLKAMRKPWSDAASPKPALTVFPNPASVFTTIAYTLPEKPSKAWLAVRDITGRKLARIPVAQAEGQAVWDTRAVAPGTYTVELVNDGTSLGTVKLVVKP